MEKDAKKVITVGPTAGKILMIAGGSYRIIVAGKETNNAFAIIEMSVPPGAGPNPHAHPDFQETFYVLEGEIHFKSESGNYLAKKDSLISIPKGGTVHGFKNLSDHSAKLLCTVIPAGLDDFFVEVAGFMEKAKKDHYPKEEIGKNMAQISEKYGQQLFEEDYLD